MKIYFCLFLAMALLYSGRNDGKLNSDHAGHSKTESGKMSEVQKDSIQPIWGYRFKLTGDFEGNGIQDTFVARLQCLAG